MSNISATPALNIDWTQAAAGSKGEAGAAHGGKGAGSRSFEDVLQQKDSAPIEKSQTGVSGLDLDRLRIELTESYKQRATVVPNLNSLVPELLESKTRMQLMRKAMEDLGGSSRSVDLRGRFGQLEAEWKEVEKIMRSSKDLSQGELLSLQARLYQVAQHIEVMSKVVDQMTSGIKTVLNTNV